MPLRGRCQRLPCLLTSNGKSYLLRFMKITADLKDRKVFMKSKKNRYKGIVYSTEYGKVCPKCGYPAEKCICGRQMPKLPDDGIVRISRETKGRKGSGVSIIAGVALDDKDLKKLSKQLKQNCGTGGTVKSGVIELQGDHRDILKEELSKLGYTVKLSGG